MGLNGAQHDGSTGAAGWPVPRRAFAVVARAGGRWRAAFPAATLRPESHRRVSEVLLDSLDRRLARAGIELATTGAAPRIACRLAPSPARTDDSPAGLACTLELEQLPRFAWDFPPAQARPLARVLEARAVEPIGVHEERRESWAVLDDEEKVVAWIDEVRHRVRPRGRSARSVSAHRLLLRGLRGYDHEFERAARVLEGTRGLAPAESDFDPGTELHGPTRPGRWPDLAPGTRALAGLARIVRFQLQVLKESEPGLRAGLDAEYLHDSRVALRRLRSLVGQLQGVLDAGERAYIVEELRWLAGCTGAARDLDTLLFELRLCEPELRADLAPVLADLEAERARQQELLVSALDSPRRAELVKRLRAAFSAQGCAHAGRRAESPFARLLGKRLRRRWKQVLARTERSGAASPAAELHELRIACKKLRYLLECCRGLVPKAELQECFAHLKGLQAILGTIQDTEVHGALIRGCAQRLDGPAGARAHFALGRFLERTEQRGREARARHAEAAGAFLLPASRARFQGLLAELDRSR